MGSAGTIFGSKKFSRRLSSIALTFLTAYLCASAISPAVQACPCNEIKAPAVAPKDDEKAGLAYSKTAEYRKEFDKAIKDAKAACTPHIGEQYVAIVSDIDETLLDNRGFFESHPEFKWSDFFGYIAEAKAPTLKKTADFLAWARKNGFAIFLVTGRSEKDRPGTILNLVRQGVAFDGLYMRPNGDRSKAAEMKTKHRKAIQDMGFQIVVNIGDQFSDLEGGLSVDCEKLPNKMYYVP
ncbi:MAG: HAD family acid phosphatase [Candidatus Obscuribacterales bacterium]|jgi:predicted secreted acid phosphatase|nr:HAD family acid phosphatase [Candidatus Obscuribacterales bacterium]